VYRSIAVCVRQRAYRGGHGGVDCGMRGKTLLMAVKRVDS
jgi:hypothetical protein